MATDDYYRIPNIEKRMVTPPDRETLHMYGKDVNNFINQELRKHLGSKKSDDSDIVLPLTASTVPAVDTDLMYHADSMVIAFIRADQNDNPELKENAQKDFKKSLIRRFGYARDLPFDFTGLANLS